MDKVRDVYVGGVFLFANILMSSCIELAPIRGYRDYNVHNDQRLTAAVWVSQSTNNIQQCVRLCWLYKGCAGVTYTPEASKCALHQDWSQNVAVDLFPDLTSAVVDLRHADMDKVTEYGCDKRPCSEQELCAPVKDVTRYRCLFMGYTRCPSDPQQVPNAAPSLSGLSVITYVCKDGHAISGSDVISTCDEMLGAWTVPNVTCTFADCGQPQDVENSWSYFSTTHYNSKVQYECFEGHVSPSDTMISTCQDNGQWTVAPEACQLVLCGNPKAVNNGEVDVLGLEPSPGNPVPPDMLRLAYGALSNHSCPTGFTSQLGSFISHCQADGQWTSPQAAGFECSIIDCGDPPDIGNSTRTGLGSFYQTRMTYTCENGYRTVTGEAVVLTCGLAGGWEGELLACLIVDCGPPPPLAGGSLSYSHTTFGAEVTFSCLGSSVFSGLTKSTVTETCLASGAWSNNEDLICIDIPCGPVPQLDNATAALTANNPPHFEVTFICDQEFMATGLDTLECLDSEPWDINQTSCVPIFCPMPPAISNADVTTSGSGTEATAHYTCLKGYGKVASDMVETIYCTDIGEWTLTDLQCEIIECQSAPPSFDNTILQTCITLPVLPGFEVFYSCTAGYYVSNDVYSLTCDGYDWTDLTVSCSAIPCGPAPAVSHASVDVKIQEDSGVAVYIATYTCYEGFRLAEPDKMAMTCANREWSSEDVVCDQVDCGSPPDVDNADMDYASTVADSLVKYTCNIGFSLNITGNHTIIDSSEAAQPTKAHGICLNTGHWQLDSFSCNITTCEPIQEPSHSALFKLEGIEYNSEATISCLNGYYMPSPINDTFVLVRCSENGTWERIEFAIGLLAQVEVEVGVDHLQCLPVDCGPPPNIENAQISYTITTLNSRADYKCNERFQSSSLNLVLTCDSSATWHTDDPFICEQYMCLDPPAMENATISVANDFLPGSSVLYSCSEGFVPESYSLLCLASLQWQDPTIRCEPIRCMQDVEAVSNAATVVYTERTVGSKAEYLCDKGFTSATNEPLNVICLKTGKWEEPLDISCVLVDCGEPAKPEFLSVNEALVVTTYLSEVQYTVSCDAPYFPVGNGTVATCQASGSWSGVTVGCFTCSSSMDISNGSLVVDTSRASVLTATYVCDADFLPLYPDLVMTCDQNDITGHIDWVWAERPTCVQHHWLHPENDTFKMYHTLASSQIQACANLTYTAEPRKRVRVDITSEPLPDETFDHIRCNLEGVGTYLNNAIIKSKPSGLNSIELLLAVIPFPFEVGDRIIVCFTLLKDGPDDTLQISLDGEVVFDQTFTNAENYEYFRVLNGMTLQEVTINYDDMNTVVNFAATP